MSDNEPYDMWSERELDRALNPGLSAARGVLIAAALSIPMWALIAVVAWLVW